MNVAPHTQSRERFVDCVDGCGSRPYQFDDNHIAVWAGSIADAGHHAVSAGVLGESIDEYLGRGKVLYEIEFSHCSTPRQMADEQHRTDRENLETQKCHSLLFRFRNASSRSGCALKLHTGTNCTLKLLPANFHDLAEGLHRKPAAAVESCPPTQPQAAVVADQFLSPSSPSAKRRPEPIAPCPASAANNSQVQS